MHQKAKKIAMTILTLIITFINLFYAYEIYSGKLDFENAVEGISMSNNVQLICLCICALINVISLILINKNLITHKKKIIVLNVIQALLGNLFNIIFGVTNIIVLCMKNTDIEENEKIKKEKKPLPILEEVKQHKWYLYFLIFMFLFVISYTPILDLLPIPESKTVIIIITACLYIIQLLALIIPMKEEIRRDFIAFKNNFKTYLSHMLPRFGIIIAIYMVTNVLLIAFVQEIPTNQSLISELPIYISALLAIVIAPITEELMFRGFMKKFIKHDVIFIIISSLIFGGLHVLAAENLPQILFIIPYSMLGFAFSLNYVKTKNIASNIFLHSMWNTFAVLMLIVSKISI